MIIIILTLPRERMHCVRWPKDFQRPEGNPKGQEFLGCLRCTTQCIPPLDGVCIHSIITRDSALQCTAILS